MPIVSNQNLKIQPDSLADYLSLQYLVAVYPEERGFTVMIPELPGCMSQGKTFDEAMVNINKAKCLWLETVYANDKTLIPLPSSFQITPNSELISPGTKKTMR